MPPDADSAVNDCTSSVVAVTTPAGARMFEFLGPAERDSALEPFVRALAQDACESSSEGARELVERAAALAITSHAAGIDITDLLGRVARLIYLTERRLGELRPDLRQDREWRAHWAMVDEMASRACIYAFSREAFSTDAAWQRALDTIASNPVGAANSVRRTAKAMDSGVAAVIATDVTGTILYWNSAATALYGWEPDEVLGHNIMHVTPASQSLADAERIMRQLAAGEVWAGTILLRDKRGTPLHAQVTDTPVLYNGVIVGIVGVSARV
ncbi:MAG TPA: PAS domain-containing protein [Gemmatimonadaceae bacterium]|jgi:PAS domain S-box-containing protein|nr:PAS domain-containing protein [Gemmatimonadaceae bacterium]